MSEYKCDDTQFRYTPEAGTNIGPGACGVCSTEMECKKDCFGPRGFAQAMSGGKSKYDSYICPHHDEVWHKQAVKLREAARETPSGKLYKMFREEADEIIKTRQATKEDGHWKCF